MIFSYFLYYYLSSQSSPVQRHPNCLHAYSSQICICSPHLTAECQILFLSADSIPLTSMLIHLQPNKPNRRLQSLPQIFSSCLAADDNVILRDIPKPSHSCDTSFPHAEQLIRISARSTLRTYPESSMSHRPHCSHVSTPPEGCD